MGKPKMLITAAGGHTGASIACSLLLTLRFCCGRFGSFDDSKGVPYGKQSNGLQPTRLNVLY